MKKIKKILMCFILCLISFWSFNDNIYADNQYECLYEDILSLEYNPENKMVTYQGSVVSENCGTVDKPCKILAKVLELEGTGLMGRLDQKRWKFFDSNNNFTCPTIYYSISCSTGDRVVCRYTFAPYKHEKDGITFSSKSATNASASDNTNNNKGGQTRTCTPAEVTQLNKTIDTEVQKFESKIEKYMSEISNYTNAPAETYATLSENYKNRINDDMNSARNELAKYQNRCDYGSEYDDALAKLIGNLKSKSSSFYSVLNGKITEAKNTASQNGEDTSAYDAALNKSNDSKENNTSKAETVRNELVNMYTSYLDQYEDVEVSCEGILGEDLLDYIDELFTWVKIAVPIIVIIMGSVDFGQAVLQDDRDALKKATNKFVKRCIIAVAIFFIPTLLSYLLHVFNAMTTTGGVSTCGIG